MSETEKLTDADVMDKIINRLDAEKIPPGTPQERRRIRELYREITGREPSQEIPGDYESNMARKGPKQHTMAFDGDYLPPE